jgi:DNA-binding CsgD family transcriptional regulator
MTKPAMRPHRRHGATNPGAALIRRRVTQETIDEMAELRRQGLPHKEIGERTGCSERTARRYVGKVQRQITVPGEGPEPDLDPKGLRERLARAYATKLHEGWKRWETVRFVAEANWQIQERLSETDTETLRLVWQDQRMRDHFLWETVGFLYRDFRNHEQLAETLFDDGLGTYSWRPPRERNDIPVSDDEEFLEPGDEV